MLSENLPSVSAITAMTVLVGTARYTPDRDGVVRISASVFSRSAIGVDASGPWLDTSVNVLGVPALTTAAEYTLDAAPDGFMRSTTIS